MQPSRKRKRAPTSKHWCLTLNNPTGDDVVDPDDFTYLVLGREKGETGTPHLQGYCVFKNRVGLARAKKYWPRAHLEIKSKNSTYQECITYCQKGDDWQEWGTVPRTNKQIMEDRWELAYNFAKAGTLEEIEKSMLVRYYHAFKRIRQDNPARPARLKDVCGMWFLGPTGSGKSHRARALFPNLYDKPLNKWWDGYHGQHTILLDDVGKKQATWLGHFLKRWGDKFSFPAESKGTTHQIRPQRIVVTSQYTIAELFFDDPELIEALERRYTVTNVSRNKTFE